MRTLLLMIITIAALLSTAAGLALIYPFIPVEGIRSELLRLTAFSNYTIAGGFWLAAVSASSWIGFYCITMRTTSQYRWTTIAGSILAGAALLQVLLTQTAGWVHLLMAGAGVLTVLISYQLKGKWAV